MSVTLTKSTELQCPEFTFHADRTAASVHAALAMRVASALFVAARCKSEEKSRKFERCEHDDPSVTVERIVGMFTPNCSAIQYASNDTFNFLVRRLQLSQERVP